MRTIAHCRGKNRRLAALWWTAVVAASCEGGDAPTTVAAPALAEADARQSPLSAASRRVVIGVRQIPATFDPVGELDPWGQRVVDDLLFDGLTRRLPAPPWAEPALASQCLTLAEGRTVACQIRSGAIFHDDTPVTTDDVVYSLGLWLGPRGAGLRHRYGLDDLKTVEAGPPPGQSGDGWVRLGFGHADPLVLERIAAMKIVSHGRHRGAQFGHQPVGTGPMRQVERSDDRVVFARRNDTPGRAHELELRTLDDGALALTSLRRGEIHILADVSPVYIPRELAKPGMASRFVGYLLTPARYDLLLFNLRDGPAANLRVRQALAQAVPRADIHATAYGVPSLAVTTPVDLHAPSEIDLVAIAEDRIAEAGLALWQMPRPDDAAGVAAAAKALTDLGWPLERGQRRRAGTALRLPISWDGSPGIAAATVRSLRAAWKQLGISTPSVTAGWAYIQNLLHTGKFSVALVRLASASDVDLSPWFHSRGAHNLTGVSDAALDAALDRYRRAQSRADRDAAKQAVAERLAELMPAVVLHAPMHVLLASRAVTGLLFVDDLPRLDTLDVGPAPAPELRIDR